MTGWKTMIFGMLVTALGTLTATDFVPWVGEMWSGVAFAAVGVVIMALRAVTNTPIFESK